MSSTDVPVRDLGTLGGTASSAYEIDDAGQGVGWSLTRDTMSRAVLWTLNGPLSPGDAAEELIDTSDGLTQEKNTKTSLSKLAQNLLASIDAGDLAAATDQLHSFINQVEAQRGKRITNTHADLLASATQETLDAIDNLN